MLTVERPYLLETKKTGPTAISPNSLGERHLAP